MKFLLGSLISFLMLTQVLVSPNPASAATCRNSGPKDSSLALGSQVDGRLFTICADNFSTQKLAHKKSSSNSKPVKPNPKVNPTGQVIFSYRRVGNTTRVSFRPVAPKAKLVTAGNLQVGQRVTFNIDQRVKLGASYVFTRRLGVRFTPIKVSVAFSDGSVADTFNPEKSFLASGSYKMSSLVTYRVEYRTLVWGEVVNRSKAKWVLEPDVISLASNPVNVTIGDKTTNQVVLVSR